MGIEIMTEGSVEAKPALSRQEYEAFQVFLEEACGIVLGAGKEYLVSSRLRPLIRKYHLASVGALLERLYARSEQKLKTEIIDAMTTNETFWFRDMAHYRILSEIVFPQFRGHARMPLRIWSAASSSGQEPYNISMVVQDYLWKSPGHFAQGVEITATDISASMLEEARRGVYCGIGATRGLSPEQQRRYFHSTADCLTVKPEIKARVNFRELNLTKSFVVLGKFDVVFCRNVLIYFSSQQKRDILNRIAGVLNPGGYLFLGSTESLASHDGCFEIVRECGGIAYRRK